MLKQALPMLGVAPAVQVLALLGVATLFVVTLVALQPGSDRRGVLFLLGTLWAAGIVKILMNQLS